MRIAVLCIVLLTAGCASHKGGSGAAKGAPPAKAVITPKLEPVGRVESVNLQARFIVVSFPSGNMPAHDLVLNVFRGGLKVGEAKITGPEQDNNTVADILTGDIQVHDEVRE